MSLDGLRIGVTSHRKASELVAALERRGADVLLGPTIGGDVPVPAAQILADTEAILDARPHWLVASTGVGMQLWADAAAENGRLDALREVARHARCVARGAKAVGGLLALGVRPVWSSAQQTDADVAGWLTDHVLEDEVVAVQLHGSAATPAAFAPVVDAGADLLSVATYRHALPGDVGPACTLIDAIVAGSLDLVVFTSPGAARNLVDIAAVMDPATATAAVDAFQDRVATGVIGPVTSSALEEHGIPAWVTPKRHRTGDLLRSLERWAARRHDAGATPPMVRLVPGTTSVRIGPGEQVELGQRGYAVLAALVRRPGVVCSPDELLAEAWGHAAPADPSAIKHQIARLRRKLAGTGVEIRTVRGAGYRLDGPEVR